MKQKIFPLVIFFLGLSLRILFYLKIKSDPLFTLPILDADYYLSWAQKIAIGQSFTSSAFWVEPGYAYLLALVLKLFSQNYSPLIFLQLVLGSLTPVLIYFAAKKMLKNNLVSFILGIVTALIKQTLFYDLLLLKTSLEIFLISFLVLFILNIWQRKRPLNFFFLGLLLGLISLIKANIFYTLPFLAGVFILQKPRFQRTKIILSLFLLAGTLLPVLPITFRNWQVSKSFVLINYSSGPNLYIGNWEGADGSLRPPEFISVNPDFEESSWQKLTQAYLGKKPSPAQVSSFWTKQTLIQSVTHPIFFLKITFKKLSLLFSSTNINDNYDISYTYSLFPAIKFLPPFWLLAILGTTGMIISLFNRKKLYLPLYVLAGSYSATVVFSHITERYRLALLPILIIFTGYLFLWFKKQVADGNYLGFTSLIIFLPLMILIALLPKKNLLTTSFPDMLNSFGSSYKDKNYLEKAKPFFSKSSQLFPNHYPSQDSYAQVLLQEGKAKEAVEIYQKALKNNPYESSINLNLALRADKEGLNSEQIKKLLDEEKEKAKTQENWDLDYIEGMRYLRRGDWGKAKERLEKTYEKYPSLLAVITNLAVVYKNLNELDKAKDFYLKALTQDEANLAANYNLILMLVKQNNLKDALPYLEKINSTVPGFLLTNFFLGEAYLEQGHKRAALMTLAKFVEENKMVSSRKSEVRKANVIIQNILSEMN